MTIAPPQPVSASLGGTGRVGESTAAAADMADGVVCFAGVDWWYHNRGHSECQIMQRLARRVPVLWVNSLGMRAPRPGKSDLVLRRYARKLKSTLKGLRKDPSGMWVLSPLFVPRYTARAVEWNGGLVGAQVRLTARLLGMRRPSVWATIPTAAAAVDRSAWTRVVFNRSDEFSAFPEADASFVRPLEQRLLARADHSVYVNRTLFERERAGLRSAEFLGHGVDFDHFAVAPLKTGRPKELLSLPRPIIGFYGALDDYTIDLDLMIKTAKANPTGTLVVIGPRAMDISRLLKEPNVAYLGPVPYARLPAYAAEFDVAIMPWLQNEWMRGCNPIKLKEYLALGFPIVTIRFSELAPFEDLVYAADTHAEFISCIAAALGERDDGLRVRRRDAVRGDTWDALSQRAGRLLALPDRNTN